MAQNSLWSNLQGSLILHKNMETIMQSTSITEIGTDVTKIFHEISFPLGYVNLWHSSLFL
jgi:hypothetical protein